MKRKKWAALLMAVCLCFTAVGCSGIAEIASGETESSTTTIDETDLFTDRDYEVGYSDYVTVTLSDAGSSTDGKGVSIDGSIVTISEEGTYLLTGSLTDGQIVVDAPETAKVQLVADNVAVSNSSSAAIYVKEADKVFLTMAEGSDNALSVTGEFVQTDENTVDGAIFSKSDLTMNGNGTLTITDEYGHGVVSKDDLKVTGGTYIITAASSGLSGKDSVCIANGTFTITTDKDGIHSENADDPTKGFLYVCGGTFTISAGTDGLDASSTLTVRDGTFTITTGGGSANASVKSNGQPNGNWRQWGGANSGTTDSTTGATDIMKVPPNRGSMTRPDDTAPQTPSDGTTGTSADAQSSTDAADSGSTDADTSSVETDTGDTTASAKGLKSGTGMELSGGYFTIDSSDDSIHTNGDLMVSGGTFAITSGDDGLHADGALTVTDGSIDVTKSYEGIEGASITIGGGSISITSSDDGLNASGGNDSSSVDGRMGQNSFDNDSSAYILISGGSLTIDADGDGIDSNGSLSVTGGTTYVSGPTNSGNGALDYGGSGSITGGIVIGAGASGMAQNFDSDSTQGSILYTFSSTQSSGTEVTLTDSDGKVLASFTPEKEYQCVVISAPEITDGSTYTIAAGSESAKIEMTSILYGTSTGMNGMMGGRGGKTAMNNDTGSSVTTSITQE